MTTQRRNKPTTTTSTMRRTRMPTSSIAGTSTQRKTPTMTTTPSMMMMTTTTMTRTRTTMTTSTTTTTTTTTIAVTISMTRRRRTMIRLDCLETGDHLDFETGIASAFPGRRPLRPRVSAAARIAPRTTRTQPPHPCRIWISCPAGPAPPFFDRSQAKRAGGEREEGPYLREKRF